MLSNAWGSAVLIAIRSDPSRFPGAGKPVCAVGCRRTPETPAVCEVCRARLLRQLTAVPELFAAALARGDLAEDAEQDADPVNRAFPAGPTRATATGPRVGGGSIHPAAPLDLDLFDLTATQPVYARLGAWVRRWRQDGDPVPGNPVSWLADHLDRACDRGDGIAEFARDLGQLTAELRRASGDHRQLIGFCPTEDCGAELHADPHDKASTCPACATAWPRLHWLWLADTMRSAA